MKDKDIILIIVVVFFSAVTSYVLSNILITSPKNRKATVEVIEPISPEFAEPSNKYFNDQAINPTKLIQIGDTANTDPFGP